MKKWLIGLLAGIGAVISIFFYGKREGANDEKAKQNKEVLNRVDESSKIDNDVNALNDDGVAERLRKYRRD